MAKKIIANIKLQVAAGADLSGEVVYGISEIVLYLVQMHAHIDPSFLTLIFIALVLYL